MAAEAVGECPLTRISAAEGITTALGKKKRPQVQGPFIGGILFGVLAAASRRNSNGSVIACEPRVASNWSTLFGEIRSSCIRSLISRAPHVPETLLEMRADL